MGLQRKKRGENRSLAILEAPEEREGNIKGSRNGNAFVGMGDLLLSSFLGR